MSEIIPRCKCSSFLPKDYEKDESHRPNCIYGINIQCAVCNKWHNVGELLGFMVKCGCRSKTGGYSKVMEDGED